METDPILQTIDDIVALVSEPNKKNDDKKTVIDDDFDDESLTITKSGGKYWYNRFGHLNYMKVADKLMIKYDIHPKNDHNDDDDDDEKKKKQKFFKRKCELTSSGMNAISAVFHGILLKHKMMMNNDKLTMNIIHSNELYCDTPKLIKYFVEFYNSNINIIKINNICNTNEIINLFQSEQIKKTNINILFIETCSNPNGYVMDFKYINLLKTNTMKNNGYCYIIMDNTWLTSTIFNPFKFGADFVVISLSKYYSGGCCIGGAVLNNGQSKENNLLFDIIANWIRINGIHISPYHCKLILNNIDLMDKRIHQTSNITKKCIDLLQQNIDNNKLLKINHPYLKNHESYNLYKKYINSQLLYSSVISFKISITKNKKVKKWLNSSNKILAKTSFGGKDTRFDTFPSKAKDGSGTWCRFAIGYNDTFENIKSEIIDMIEKLNNL